MWSKTLLSVLSPSPFVFSTEITGEEWSRLEVSSAYRSGELLSIEEVIPLYARPSHSEHSERQICFSVYGGQDVFLSHNIMVNIALLDELMTGWMKLPEPLSFQCQC